MVTRRGVLAASATGVFAVAGCMDRSDNGTPEEGRGTEGSLTVRADAFDDGGDIPSRHSCDGEDVSPGIAVEDVPERASTLAVVVDDPDAPGDEPFVHWLLWDLPVDGGVRIPEEVPTGERVEALDGARQGRNDMDVVGYSGPCPPEDETHGYRFLVHAVEGELGLEGGADRGALDAALDGRNVDRGLLTGTYRRS